MFLQGHPPSLRFGHPDVTFGRYRLSALGYCAGAAAFSGCALRVSARTLSDAERGGAERPGDGCPCVGAEEICGAPPLILRTKTKNAPSVSLDTDGAFYLRDELLSDAEVSQQERVIPGDFTPTRIPAGTTTVTARHVNLQ